MSELIELRNVTVTSGGHAVLNDVSVSFPDGGCTVIMGPSGCGKSTLLKVAAGLILPDQGSVFWRGADTFWMSERKVRDFRKVSGFSFQDSALWENKSIFDNLALPLQVHHPEMAHAEVNQRVTRMLERGRLAASAPLRPAQLSIGERKVASFLRAIVAEPTILFLDTPTGTMDKEMVEMVTETIRDMKARGCTILAVTHDRRVASTLADRFVVVHEGSLLFVGSFEEVKGSIDPRVHAVLSEVFGEIASFDRDLLSLMDGRDEN
jgi:ABC-type transporter Mla maintaining outer membrane lipid asymmetry ATPase subunit MlaF